VLHHFYRFLDQSKLEIQWLEKSHIDQYEVDLARHGLKHNTIWQNVAKVFHYVVWLEKNEYLSKWVTPKAFPNHKQALPKEESSILPERAQNYLELLSATLKKDTVFNHQASILGFYRCHPHFLVSEKNLGRDQIEAYMKYLSGRKLSATTRCARLLNVRSYLFWLYEHGKVKVDPFTIIRTEDFPKRPSLLPKPYPPQVFHNRPEE
jgi:site-specific recombinase XerD